MKKGICQKCGQDILIIKNYLESYTFFDVEKIKIESFKDPKLIKVYDSQGRICNLKDVFEGYWLHNMTCEARFQKTAGIDQKKIKGYFIKVIDKNGKELSKISTNRRYKLGDQISMTIANFTRKVLCSRVEKNNGYVYYIFQ